MAPEVVVLGRIAYDLIAEEANVPLARVRKFVRYLGGSSANMAVGLARLGARTGMVAALGPDGLSDFLEEFLKNEGVDTTHVQRVPGFLPQLALTELFPPDRFPQVFYRVDPADTKLAATEEMLRYVEGAQMLVTNGTSLCAEPSRGSTYRAMERSHRSGTSVVFDVDYRSMSWPGPEEAAAAVERALPWIDVLLANEPELKMVAHTADVNEAAKLLASRVPTLVSKLGGQGTRVWQGGDSVFEPPYKVPVVSTIGAGDGFAAGFLYGLLRGLPLVDCLHHGNASAAIVVSRLDCSEAMPRLEEIRRLMAEQRER
jgi:5-dehydro-2-deoxygluconokinase